MEMRANTLEKGKIGQKASSKETKKKIENCRVERSSTHLISKQNLRKKERGVASAAIYPALRGVVDGSWQAEERRTKTKERSRVRMTKAECSAMYSAPLLSPVLRGSSTLVVHDDDPLSDSRE